MTQAQQEQASVTFLSNLDPSEFGRNAADNWTKANKANGNGDQLAIMAAAIAYDSFKFHCEVTNAKGHFERRIDFNLQQWMHQEVVKDDGKKDNRATTARTRAVMKELFGLEEPKADQVPGYNNAINRLKSAIKVVEFLKQRGCRLVQVQDDGSHAANTFGWNEKKKCLSIPYAVLYIEPPKDAEDEAKIEFNKYKDDNILLNGKKVHGKFRTVEELKRVAKPKEERGAHGQNSNNKTTPAQSMVSSLKHLDTCIDLIVDEKVPNDKAIAPNKEITALMWKLSQRFVAYFEKFPLTKEEEARFEKTEENGKKTETPKKKTA
jgi:hypothetical protein